MSSRIRFVAQVSGSLYAGRRGLTQLEKLWMRYHGSETPPSAKGWRRMTDLLSGIGVLSGGKSLLVLREHRGVKRSKSQYMNLCSKYGVGRRVIETPTNPRLGVRGGRIVLEAPTQHMPAPMPSPPQMTLESLREADARRREAENMDMGVFGNAAADATNSF